MIYIDSKGKEIKEKAFKTVQANYQFTTMVQSGEDKVIVAEQNQLIEYSLKTGKAEEKGFRRQVNNTRSFQKLPNGNILFVDMNVYPARVVEITPEGEEAWVYQSKDPQVTLVKAMVR